MSTQEELSSPEQSTSIFREALPLDVKLERARTELLDLSARNRLLNTPRSAKSARSIEVVDEKSGEIYRLLVEEGKTFTFLPGREAHAEDQPAGLAGREEVTELAQPEDSSMDERGVLLRHIDTKLQTRLTSQGLQKRLLELYTDAITLEQEQGVNILYLALGMLKWIDPKDAELARYAPLILVPVTLERGTAAERFKLKARTEDVSSNLSLEAYLDRVHKMRLPEFDLTEGFDPALYMLQVAEAVKSKEQWQVCEDDIVLGFFSFAKFLMYRDLDPECWPDDAQISQQPLVRSLLAEGFSHQDDLLDEDGDLDSLLKPCDMVHIVDCDSSQALAVHEVRRGKNLVIQGPPGTGKSQTIANVIASAIADGKTVLFVAEKMAALEVVKRRLDRAGVGDACLELHSNKANKRLLLQELSRTWDLGSPRGVEDSTLDSSLLAARDGLNDYVSHLHAVHRLTGLTPFQVMGELARLHAEGVPPTEYPLGDAPTWTPDQRKEREELLDEIRERIVTIGPPAEHPWRGIDLPPLLPTDVARLAKRIESALDALRSYLRRLQALAETLQSEEPKSLDEAKPLEALGHRVAAAPTLSSSAFLSEAWENPDEIQKLIGLGISQKSLATNLNGRVNIEDVLRVDRTELRTAIGVLAGYPQNVSEVELAIIPAILGDIPQICAATASLSRLVKSAATFENLSSVEGLLKMAAQVATAPALSSGAFSSDRWETEVERAHDIAEELVSLENAKELVGNQVSDSGWQADLSETRQVLAQYGTSFMRFFSGRWRQQNRFANSFLANPKAPLSHKLTLLDALERGRKASAEVEREKEFGSEIFGPEWRGARSVSSHLLALTDWMRGLGRFPVPSERTTIRGLAAAGLPSDALRAEIANVQDLVRRLCGNLTTITQITSSDARFGELVRDLAPVAQADAIFRRLVRQAPSVLSERVAVLRAIDEFLSNRDSLSEARTLGTRAFGDIWQGEDSDWEKVASIAAWITANQDIRSIAGGVEDRASLPSRAADLEASREEHSRDVPVLADLLHWDIGSIEGGSAVGSLSLRALEARLNLMLEKREQLSHWTSYQERSKRAAAMGLGEFVRALETGVIAGANLLRFFHSSCYEGILQDQLREFPELARFDGGLHERNIGNFRSMDLQHIKTSALTVARTHHRHIPPSGGIGPVGILRGEIARQRRHMPIRQLMSKAAPVVQALKPVIMMSPLSVAQFLSPGQMKFDLLVMDEASQIQPVDALGAVARCRQIVVVGDERQLPPTKFFSKMTSDAVETDDEDAIGAQAGDVESILGLCLARGIPQRMLRWHYRSRHQSLIAVSNSQFYENKLHIIPSPYTQEAGTGLRFIHIPNGVFESGGTGANPIEAKAVAEAIIRHALDHPEQSLGVATFSVRQRKVIQDHLEAMRRMNPLSEPFFTAHPSEPFFIKNLENVQGDERDVIFISVGYGRNENGFFAMRFGPLGSEGGERRLNVLISRAKRRCDVFASIMDDDIDTDRAKGKGVVAFKLFLHYARTGRLQMGHFASEEIALSTLGDQIAHVIQKRGYQVHRQVGLSGLFIDIAVADPEKPGRYILGVELDGRSYANARSARDRDRLRNTVLRDHGWQLHRIWAMDWLQRPEEQAQRLLVAIEGARESLKNEGLREAKVAVPVEIVTIERGDVSEVSLETVSQNAAHFYTEATLAAVPTFLDLPSTSTALLAKFVKDVATIEGPVHRDEVVVRIRSAWNLQRSGGRIQAALDAAIEQAIQDGLIANGDFLDVAGKEPQPRDRSLVISPGLRRIEMLPPAEVDSAILKVIGASMGATTDQTIQAVSRLFGFKSTSTQLRNLIDDRRQFLVNNRKLTEKDGMLSIL
ncbi:MAG TPA: DUF3320 domain-containing protein [Acidobacteriaceae bacterium]|jgi:very-short-patch-repair endonuclease